MVESQILMDANSMKGNAVTANGRDATRISIPPRRANMPAIKKRRIAGRSSNGTSRPKMAHTAVIVANNISRRSGQRTSRGANIMQTNQNGRGPWREREVSVRVDIGGGGIIKKTKNNEN